MSMFKTLQSTPGTVTLFHRNTGSSALLQLLKSHSSSHTAPMATVTASTLWSKVKTGFGVDHKDTTRYVIEETTTPPTYDQLKLIKSYATTSEQNTKVFNDAFPVLKERFINGEEFKSLVKSTEWFVEPLVVDWEKGNLANDEASVRALVKVYE